MIFHSIIFLVCGCYLPFSRHALFPPVSVVFYAGPFLINPLLNGVTPSLVGVRGPGRAPEEELHDEVLLCESVLMGTLPCGMTLTQVRRSCAAFS